MNDEHPLGIPKGSVRAIVVLVVLAVLCVLALRGMEPPQWLLTLGTALLGEYVGRRAK